MNNEDVKDDEETKEIKQQIAQSIRNALNNSFIGCEKLELEHIKQKMKQAIKDMLEKIANENEIYLTFPYPTVLLCPYPIKHISYNFCLSVEEDHTGMVYNPYSDKWSYL